MTDRKIAKYNLEMAEHANGAAQYLDALLGGRHVTTEQTREMVDFLLLEQRGIPKVALLRPKTRRMLRYIEEKCY